jgi:hypothetical protein
MHLKSYCSTGRRCASAQPISPLRPHPPGQRSRDLAHVWRMRSVRGQVREGMGSGEVSVDLKLRIFMVPTPLWQISLRSKLPQNQWRQLRSEMLNDHGLFCDECGKVDNNSRRFHAHETWAYEETGETAAASLTGIGVICSECHAVIHFGRSRSFTMLKCPACPATDFIASTGLNGELEFTCSVCQTIAPDPLERARTHLCQVNNVSLDAFQGHRADAFSDWRRRSEMKWTVDWGPYRPLVERSELRRSARRKRAAP